MMVDLLIWSDTDKGVHLPLKCVNILDLQEILTAVFMNGYRVEITQSLGDF